MTFDNIKSFVVGTIKQAFKNKKTLDKFTENEDGKVLYNGSEIATDINISEQEGNALQKQEDGLFVKDNVEKIQEISDNISSIKKYQKYVNTELDSCHCRLNENYTTVVGEYIPFTKVSGNMNVKNGFITIKPGSRVQINLTLGFYDTSSTEMAYMKFFIKDVTNDETIGILHTANTVTTEYSRSSSWQYTNDTENDVLIGAYLDMQQKADILQSNITSLTVHEIGRQITINPVEYVNTKSGIEDTPVGYIISYTGSTPKHYLICDGAEYNISDYPYLVQYFKDTYGIVNYFGGDGENTFAIPNNEVTKEKINFTKGNTISNGHSENYVELNAFDNNPGTFYSCQNCAEDLTQEKYIGWDFGCITSIDSYSITNRKMNSNDIPCSPTSFRLQGSNDNINWVDLNIQENIVWTTTNETKVFDLNKTYAYHAYRLFVDVVPYGNGSIFCVAELNFYRTMQAKYIKYEPTYYIATKNYNYLQPSLYSNEEKIIGSWINGKPLYQKVCNLGNNIQVTGGTSVITNVSASNIDSLVSGTLVYESPTQYGFGFSHVEIWSNNSCITFKGYENWSAKEDRYLQLIIQYTKRTDAENSFDNNMLDYTGTTPEEGENIVYEEYTNEDVTNAINAIW